MTHLTEPQTRCLDAIRHYLDRYPDRPNPRAIDVGAAIQRTRQMAHLICQRLAAHRLLVIDGFAGCTTPGGESDSAKIERLVLRELERHPAGRHPTQIAAALLDLDWPENTTRKAVARLAEAGSITFAGKLAMTAGRAA